MTVEQNLNLIQIIKSENLIFTIILTLKQEQMFDIIIETLVPYFQQFLLLRRIYTD